MATTSDIRLPADAIRSLRHSLIRQVGSDVATHALQEAGHAAGDQLVAQLADDGFGNVPADTFWARLADHFQDANWGTIEHDAPHPGVGAITAHDWFEAGQDGRSCPFTTGILANILGHAADGEVAVLQVPCDDDESGCVRFLFGAPGVLDRLYDGVREGGGVEAGLAALG
jgi:hypothetical protein